MLYASGSVHGVGSPVMRIDNCTRTGYRSYGTSGSSGRQTPRTGEYATGEFARPGRLIYCLQSGHPTVLGKIIVEKSKPCAKHSIRGLSRGICDAQPRSNGATVVVRQAGGERYLRGCER
jgi:hypothetical protein